MEGTLIVILCHFQVLSWPLAGGYRKAVQLRRSRGVDVGGRRPGVNVIKLFPLSLSLRTKRIEQGTLTEGEGSIQLTSSYRLLFNKENHYLKQVATNFN